MRGCFYSATGGVFRRIFLPTPPEQKCGNFFRRCAAAQVAHTGGERNEMFSVARMARIRIRSEIDGQRPPLQHEDSCRFV
jgi:hypothetical protein